MRCVLFRLEKEHYAIPLAAVREVVVAPSSYTRVPRSPKMVRGVMNLRGRVVTVVELASLLTMPAATPGPMQKIVMLDRGRRDLGLLVSDVEGIESVERVVPAPGKPAPEVRGVARIRGWAVTVLEPEGVDGLVIGLFGNK